MKALKVKKNRPIMFENYYCWIKLEKSQVETGDVQKKAIKEGYRTQTYRHITILGGDTKREVKAALSKHSPKERRKIVTEIKSLLQSFDWQFTQTKLYHISKKGYFGTGETVETRCSYIREVNIPDLKTFYKKLNYLLHTRLPVQFPHITLFTKGEREEPDYYGIPISSKSEFKKLHPKLIK